MKVSFNKTIMNFKIVIKNVREIVLYTVQNMYSVFCILCIPFYKMYILHYRVDFIGVIFCFA